MLTTNYPQKGNQENVTFTVATKNKILRNKRKDPCTEFYKAC
jgi:hypothetical protein